MRWFASLSFRRVILLGLLWPLVLMVIVSAVTAVRIARADPDDGYFLVASIPRLELIIAPPIVLVATWWLIRRRNRGAA